ncbi:uncharacterized protein [Macrobrachium rosenbergii]|uniref:uncharacterized protein isoform X3 n=2 Tax=Macrobrachium rosenbergii TaxID=79674 RepID=UPI0034D40931
MLKSESLWARETSEKMKLVTLHIYFLLMSSTMVTDVCLAVCGCNDTGQVYIQYKPPATGWFKLVSGLPCFRRELSMKINSTVFEYNLCFTRQWTLYERSSRDNSTTTIQRFGRKANKLKIICPPTDCRRSTVIVSKHNYLSGKYYPVHDGKVLSEEIDLTKLKTDDPTTMFINMTQTRKSVLHSPVMTLSELSTCLQNRNANSEVNDDVFNRTKSVVYVREDSFFNLTQTPEGDFWWITSEDLVYAISNQGAACVYDLPGETKWLEISESEHKTRTMTVHYYQ